jgi:hypothetical protein
MKLLVTDTSSNGGKTNKGDAATGDHRSTTSQGPPHHGERTQATRTGAR